VKVVNIVSYIILILAILVIGYSSFNLLYPYPTVDVKAPAPILNEGPIHPGVYLHIQLEYDKYTDQPATVVRQFMNDIVYTVPSFESNYPTGKNLKISCTTRIPPELTSGWYYLKTTLEYNFPPFREIDYTYETQKFYVERN
jgi:hypothetical protein